MGTQINPLGNRILIQPDPQQETTAGGIILTEKNEKPMSGTVMAKGPGKKDSNMDAIAVGAKVLYGKYAGTEVKVDGDDMLIVSEDDILAIISE